jgi:hypothetical protein
MLRVKFIINENPMKKTLNANLLFPFLIAAASIIIQPNPARANTPHLIINEIQVAGANSNDEFVELFNPTDASIDLEGYKLTKKTKGGTENTLVSAAKFSGTVEARGYFLIAHLDYKDGIAADLPYSSSSYSISKDNTVLLYDKNGTLLDKVGFGTASDFETAPAPNPNSNESIERLDFVDTDNNAADFSANTSPSPRNSSFIETDGENSSADTGDDGSDNDNPAPDTSNPCTVPSKDIRLNEILPYPAGGEEFVEVVNIGSVCADISGWIVMDETNHKKVFPEKSILQPGEYLFLEGNLYLNNDSDTVYLLDKNGNSKNDALDRVFFEKAKKGFSCSFDGNIWNWTSSPTPGKKNVIDSDNSDENQGDSDSNSENDISSSGKAYLNEIFPNPKKDSGDEEYIEIAGGENAPVDLFGWRLKDESKSKGFQFKEHIVLNPGEYLAIYKSQSKIALNNSNESVYLYNPKGEVASSASFEKSLRGASYNFDGENWPASNALRSNAGWKWSKYLTPGKKNKFDSPPTVKIKKPKNIFKEILAEFSAIAKDKETKKLKYSWDFGDGKKSSLKKTTHKYLDTGKYTVTLAVADESQTVEKSFTVNVKNSFRPDLEIVKIVPNPAGADNEGETIDIKNNSGKKVNLAGWKIATGSGEKMYNHPIGSEVNMNPNETKTITREFSKFSLNNKAGKVQLAMPDGKIVDEVEYSKDKIAEDEAYAKTDGEWQWIAPEEQDENANKETDTDDKSGNESANEEEPTDEEILGAVDETVSEYSPAETIFFSENAFIFLSKTGFFPPAQEKNYCPMHQSSSLDLLVASLI